MSCRESWPRVSGKDWVVEWRPLVGLGIVLSGEFDHVPLQPRRWPRYSVCYAEILKTTVTVARSWIDVCHRWPRKRDPWLWTRGGKVPRDRWAAGGERAWRAEARRKESGKVGQGHDGRTAAKGRNLRWRKRGVGGWGVRESRSGRMDRGRDKMHGAALCCTALAPLRAIGEEGGGLGLRKRLKSSRA